MSNPVVAKTVAEAEGLPAQIAIFLWGMGNLTRQRLPRPIKRNRSAMMTPFTAATAR